MKVQNFRAGQATVAVRAGQHQFVDDQHSEAMVLTSSYTFDDAHDAPQWKHIRSLHKSDGQSV